MADESILISDSALNEVHEDIKQHGYALTSESHIGLPVMFSKYLRDAYFDRGRIRRHDGDIPEDRERARDVVYYEWDSDKLELAVLEEYETIIIRNRAGIEGERLHERIELLQDYQVRNLIATFISLVPVDRRQPKGTFGVNLFRTHTDVVTKPHRDEEEFIILYVLDREGDGAESYLYKNDGQGPGVPEDVEPVFQQQLNPGDLMIFDDKRFKHGATPLTPPPGGKAKRDVLVCTLDYATSYLERAVDPCQSLSEPAFYLSDTCSLRRHTRRVWLVLWTAEIVCKETMQLTYLTSFLFIYPLLFLALTTFRQTGI